MGLSNDEVLSLIRLHAESESFYLKKHARDQRIARGMTIDEVKDVLLNVTAILRIDTNNPDGITSYKIKGGAKQDRLSIKFEQHANGSMLAVITVMDNQNKRERGGI